MFYIRCRFVMDTCILIIFIVNTLSNILGSSLGQFVQELLKILLGTQEIMFIEILIPPDWTYDGLRVTIFVWTKSWQYSLIIVFVVNYSLWIIRIQNHMCTGLKCIFVFIQKYMAMK